MSIPARLPLGENNFVDFRGPIVSEKNLNKQDSKITHVAKENFIDSSDEGDRLPEDFPSMWQDALDDLIEDDETSILEMLKSNSSDLSEEYKGIIFDRIFAAMKRQPLLESINLSLPLNYREDLLQIGLDQNDIAIVDAAIYGNKGQKTLNFDTWSRHDSFARLKSLQDKGIDPLVISRLCSISSLGEEDLRDGEWRKFLFNLWGLEDGSFKIKGEEIEYEGAKVNFFASKILDCFKSYTTFFPQDNDLFDDLFTLIEEASLTPLEKVNRYAKKKPILVHAGNGSHLIDLIFWNKIFLVCNQGLFSKVPIEVYKIQDKKLVNEKLIDHIQNTASQFSLKKMGKYFTKDLPKQLSGSHKHELTELLEKYWIGNKEQEGSDCVYRSTFTALAGVAAILNLKQSIDEEPISDLICDAFDLVNEWDSYFSIWGLERYLEYCHENPSRTDEHLLDRVFDKAIIRNSDNGAMLTILDHLKTCYRQILDGIKASHPIFKKFNEKR